MNVMKNWGCLNKIKLVGILLVRGPYFIFLPVSLPPHRFFRLLFAKLASASTRSIDNLRYTWCITNVCLRDYYYLETVYSIAI